MHYEYKQFLVMEMPPDKDLEKAANTLDEDGWEVVGFCENNTARQKGWDLLVRRPKGV